MALTAAASDSEPAVSSAPLVKGRDGSDSDPERVTATSESATEIESLAAAGLPTAGGLSDIEKTEERDRLSARVFDLENRLRETEEELEYYFDFYKKARRGKRGGTTNASNRRDGLSDTRKSEKKGDGERETAGARDDDSDSDLEDGAAPGNQNYTGIDLGRVPRPRRSNAFSIFPPTVVPLSPIAVRPLMSMGVMLVA